MRLLLWALAVAVNATAVAAKPPVVSVDFDEGAPFSDASIEPSRAAQGETAVRQQFERRLGPLAARCLAAGERIHMTIVDLDLAGTFEPHPGTGVRVLRGAATPKVDFRFVVYGPDGSEVAKGSERLTTASFLGRDRILSAQDTTLRYESDMLAAWFEGRFCKARPAPR